MTAIPPTRAETDIGYRGLLNVACQPHATVFVTDFMLPPATQRALGDQLSPLPTRVHFVDAARLSDVDGGLPGAKVDLDATYLSVHAIACTHEAARLAQRLFRRARRGDFTRVELPYPEFGDPAPRAAEMVDVLSAANYREQEERSARFLRLLASRKPYEIQIACGPHELIVRDDQPWFQLAGRLQPGEERILPGGEMAYTGPRVDGAFLVDGALLATPTCPAAAPFASKMARFSVRLAEDPLLVRVKGGLVVDVVSQGPAAGELLSLLDRRWYGEITEVGVSFNRACARFVHEWPAPSNEGHPGVHIAIGGDPDPRRGDLPRPDDLVHIDLMSASARVSINGTPFDGVAP